MMMTKMSKEEAHAQAMADDILDRGLWNPTDKQFKKFLQKEVAMCVKMRTKGYRVPGGICPGSGSDIEVLFSHRNSLFSKRTWDAATVVMRTPRIAHDLDELEVKLAV